MNKSKTKVMMENYFMLQTNKLITRVLVLAKNVKYKCTVSCLIM